MIQLYNTALARRTNFPSSSVSLAELSQVLQGCLGSWGATSSDLPVGFNITYNVLLTLFRGAYLTCSAVNSDPYPAQN